MTVGAPTGWKPLVPDALTIIRPFLGAACAWALLVDEPELAGWLYLVGYLTDVGDGMAARALHTVSARGQRLDGVCDVAFHAFVGLGLVVRGLLDDRLGLVLVVAGIWVAGQILPQWITVHSVAGKAVGGVNRIVLMVVFVALCPPGSRGALAIGTAAVFGVTYVYEAHVTLTEHRHGDRPTR